MFWPTSHGQISISKTVLECAGSNSSIPLGFFRVRGEKFGYVVRLRYGDPNIGRFDPLPMVKIQFRRQFWNVQALTNPSHLVSSGYVAKNLGTWLGYVMGSSKSKYRKFWPTSRGQMSISKTVLECVGSNSSIQHGFARVRGGKIGYVVGYVILTY